MIHALVSRKHVQIVQNVILNTNVGVMLVLLVLCALFFLLAHLIAKKDTIVGNLFKLITVLTLFLSVGTAIGFWG